MNIRLEDLRSLRYIHEELPAKAQKKIKNVSTDSRSLKEGDLFIALRGETFDGHKFISDIASKGAIAAIVDTKWYRSLKGKKAPLPVLVVENTLDAMGELALAYRKQFSIPILIVAGSNGKTTTKELVAHVLGSSFNVLKTQANFNNQVGVPQMLFQLRDEHEIAVLEIGTNHPGEIAWLANVIQPTHALITNIGAEHLEFFKDLDGVAREELTAFAITEEIGGFGFINYDDKYLRPFREFFAEWSVSYGVSTDSDIVAKRVGFGKDGKLLMEIQTPKKKIKIASSLISEYAPNMFAAAVAIGLHFEMSLTAIKKQLESYVPYSKRMEILRTKKGVTIINDTYNANPASFLSALATLDAIPSPGKKYIAAGDMFELGESAAKEHTALGKKIASYDLAGSFFIGTHMKKAFAEVKKKKKTAHIFQTKKECGAELGARLSKGDVILIKGSRGMKMEELIPFIG